MTEEEILEAIQRSGYMFESDVVKKLNDLGYFVESNVVAKDELTGKDREIDIVAEDPQHRNLLNMQYISKISIKIHYFFELKNNLYPIVLMTESNSPTMDLNDFYKAVVTIPEDMNQYEIDIKGFQSKLLLDSSGVGLPSKKLYTQYCSFEPKKSGNNQTGHVMMAKHPEELYSGLKKIGMYCHNQAIFRERQFRLKEHAGSFFRDWLYLPVLLIKNDLYELYIENATPKLKKAKMLQLIVNFHIKNKPISVVTMVVTNDFLNEWLTIMDNLKKTVWEEAVAHYNQRSTM